MGLTSDTVIRELGGGAASILVVILLLGMGVLALVVRALWAKVNALQDQRFNDQQACNSETKKLQETSNAAFGAVNTSLAAINTSLAAILAAMRERSGRGWEDHK